MRSQTGTPLRRGSHSTVSFFSSRFNLSTYSTLLLMPDENGYATTPLHSLACHMTTKQRPRSEWLDSISVSLSRSVTHASGRMGPVTIKEPPPCMWMASCNKNVSYRDIKTHMHLYVHVQKPVNYEITIIKLKIGHSLSASALSHVKSVAARTNPGALDWLVLIG